MRKAAILFFLICLLALITMIWPEDKRIITSTVEADRLAAIPGMDGGRIQAGSQLMVTITQPARLLPGKKGHFALVIQSVDAAGEQVYPYGFASRLEIPRQIVEPNGLTRKISETDRAAFHWNIMAVAEGALQGTLWVFLLPGEVEEPVAILAIPVEIPASNRMGLDRQGLGWLALASGASAGLLTALDLLKGKSRNEHRL